MIRPQMLTQKIDRPNKNYPEGYISPKHFFKKYPYKTTKSGMRSNIVAANELSDHPYRLTQGEYTKIIQTYFKYLAEYLITGKIYKFPVPRLGSIKLVKLKWQPKINFVLFKKTGHKAPTKYPYMFNYVPSTLREDLTDDDQIRSWALQVLKMLNIPNARYVKDILFDEVTNHKVKLPENLKKIYKVSFAEQPPTDDQFNDFCRCEGTTDAQDVLDEDCTTVYHHLFLSSDYYQSKYQPMQYKGIRLSDDYICNVEWGGCRGFYSIDTTGQYLTLSEATGYVVIEYYAEMTDANGNYLIPDIEALKNSMAHYVIAMYYRDRAIRAERNAYQLYKDNLQTAKTYMLDARAQLIGGNINIPLHRELINYDSRITKVHRRFRTHD